MAVELTPTDKLFIMNLDQNEFQGFSYTNPEFVIQAQTQQDQAEPNQDYTQFFNQGLRNS
ncbi:hypothetical protein ABG768_000201 [Culter alburnus]|uniref:Protein kinase C-terminal domain-containing protein n=1 Tax=Culter alburnus TaxID=194366 RepID=A0AAW2B599_CULAL